VVSKAGLTNLIEVVTKGGLTNLIEVITNAGLTNLIEVVTKAGLTVLAKDKKWCLHRTDYHFMFNISTYIISLISFVRMDFSQ
jgi:hypothetical protein